MGLFLFASWIGSIAFALSGFLVGVRKGFDLLGIFILAFLTANGGGMIRDMLVGRPPLVLTDLSAFLLVVGVFLVGLVLHHWKHFDIEKRSFFILSDSIGLVAFSLTGALIGVEYGLSIFGVIVLSFITATGGGILRDILVNEVPVIFSSDFYGSVAIILGTVIHLLHQYGLDAPQYTIISFALALTVRIVAYKQGWYLPRLRL